MDSSLDQGLRRRRRHSEFQLHDPRALIDLPLSLPSIPILNPVLTPLVNGQQGSPTPSLNSPVNTPGTTSSPTPVVQPTPPPQGTTNGGSPGGGGGQNTPGTSDAGSPPANGGSGNTSPPDNGGSGNTSPPANDGSGNSTPSSSPSQGSGSVPNSNGATTGPGSPSSATGTSPSLGASPVVNASNDLNHFEHVSSTSTDANANVSDDTSSSGLHSSNTTPTIGLGSNNPGAGGGSNTPGSGASGSPSPMSASSKPGISAGAIAGIVVVAILILIGVIIFFVRRRYRAKRAARRENWLGYGNTPGTQALPRTGFSSTRSSFASPDVSERMEDTYPQSSPYFHSNIPIGDLAMPPQMSQLTLPPVAVVIEHTGGSNSRSSVYSIGSDSSGGHEANDFNLATAMVRTVDEPLPSPILIRPFTPSESWAFPKPPGSGTTSPPPGNSDPVVGGASSFSHVETIKRPFVPTMHDELPVVPGDSIRVIRTFDDGWVMVEKLGGLGENVQGLIPVDCLRAAGEQLPSFIASKRLSSYGDVLETPQAI